MVWLDDPALIAERSAALGKPHIAPLEIWREGLVGAGHPVPHFDPFDGGIDARLLLLLETPGPGPDRTRFVSRDNPSGTARNLRRYLEAADIGRHDIVQWNCVPWIVHAPGARNRALRRARDFRRPRNAPRPACETAVHAGLHIGGTGGGGGESAHRRGTARCVCHHHAPPQSGQCLHQP